ncbi:hypothetical protein [Anabaena azotica]|uniref:hypothetical protein n=1 Tax=Anabaena azotica TaxID=197653 RepID=UPI0039A45428
MEESVKILQHIENKYVDGKILPLSQKHIEEIEFTWKPLLKNNNCWDKDLEFRKYLKEKPFLNFYVLEYNLVAQGVIVLYPNYESRLALGQNIIYVNLLTVAPWNRLDLKQTPDYKGIGTTLITFAVIHSMNLGFEGRIGLHSVKESEYFYEKMNFINLGYDKNCCNLKYLELPTDEAELLVLNHLLLCNLNNQLTIYGY